MTGFKRLVTYVKNAGLVSDLVWAMYGIGLAPGALCTSGACGVLNR